MSDLNDVLKKIEATEANLAKLDRIWREIADMLPSVNIGLLGGTIAGVEDEPRYQELERNFEHIRKAMPKLDDFEISNCIVPCESILQNMIDLVDLDEPFASLDYQYSLTRQGEVLSKYRFRLNVKRRDLAREFVGILSQEITAILDTLKSEVNGWSEDRKMPQKKWESIDQKAKEIEALLGGHLKKLPEWGDFRRHVHFGKGCDFHDIFERDWPAIQEKMTEILYGEEDPIPIGVKDIGSLIASKPTGRIVTALKWSALNDEKFERLIYNVIKDTPGYENLQWLMHTNAPDRGRDLSVSRIQQDGLGGSRCLRILVQCKRVKSSLRTDDVVQLQTRMRLWEPPRIDELIIATTGRFTQDAVQWVEKHNRSDTALFINMWPENHIESLLAQRPELIAEFGLR